MRSAFTYTNTGEAVLTKDRSRTQYQRYYDRSTTANSPVTFQPFVLFKNVDNHIQLVINDENRRLANIHDVTIRGKLIQRRGMSVVVNKEAVVDSYVDSTVTFHIPGSDIANLDNGLYDWVVTMVTSDQEELLLHPQLNFPGNWTVEIKESGLPDLGPIQVALASDFSGGDGDTDPQYSSGYKGNRHPDINHSTGLHTIAIYHTNFLGKVYVQGTVEPEPNTTTDWFQIETSAIHNTEIFRSDDSSRAGASNPRAVNFTHNLWWLRFYYIADEANTGTIDKITLRQ